MDPNKPTLGLDYIDNITNITKVKLTCPNKGSAIKRVVSDVSYHTI